MIAEQNLSIVKKAKQLLVGGKEHSCAYCAYLYEADHNTCLYDRHIIKDVNNKTCIHWK